MFTFTPFQMQDAHGLEKMSKEYHRQFNLFMKKYIRLEIIIDFANFLFLIAIVNVNAETVF